MSHIAPFIACMLPLALPAAILALVTRASALPQRVANLLLAAYAALLLFLYLIAAGAFLWAALFAFAALACLLVMLSKPSRT